MAILEIDGKEYEAKCTFGFDRLAKKKYENNEDENKLDGFTNIYMNLLEYSNDHLLAFWDCGLEHLGKDKPKLEEIEEAIMARIDEDEDTEPLFKEAFRAVDQSGFFKRRAKKFWRDFEIMKKSGKTEEEKEQNEKMHKLMAEARNGLME
jgi:hypothetical protein